MIRLFRFLYDIVHVASRSQWTADSLSRAPIVSHLTVNNVELENAIEEFSKIYIRAGR